MAGIKDVIDTLDSAAEKFEKVVDVSQKDIYKDVVALVKTLELDDKNHVKQTIANLQKLTVIKSKLGKIANNDKYLAGVGQLLKYFDVLQKQQNAYFSANFPAAALGENAKKRHALMKQIAVQNTIQALTDDGLKAGVTDKLNDILLRAVTTNAKFGDLQEELRAHLLGKDGGSGALARYATTYAVTAVSQFTGQNNKLLTEDLGCKWFMYVGSNVETTREFCQHLSKKRYVHISEIPDILKGKIDDHQCEIYKKTNLPYGMIEGTNEGNFQVNCGGWNCRHQLVPVNALAVPAEIRAKFPEEKPVTKPEPIPEEAYKADLDTFMEYLSKHKSGKVAGIVSQMYEAAEEGDTNLLNKLIEEAKATIAKNEASIKSKAALKEAKKKAEEEAKKAAEDAVKQAKLQSMLALASSVSVYQGYVAYQEQMQNIADAITTEDEDALNAAIADIHKIEADMATLVHIIDVSKWSKKFTYNELKEADIWLENKIAKLSTWPLEKQLSSLTYDVNTYLNKPEIQAVAAAWEVEQEALAIMLTDVSNKIFVKSLQDDIDKISAYTVAHPKSGKVADDLQEIKDQIANGQYDEAKATAAKALKTISVNESSRNSKKKNKNSADVTSPSLQECEIEVDMGAELKDYDENQWVADFNELFKNNQRDSLLSSYSRIISTSAGAKRTEYIKKAFEYIKTAYKDWYEKNMTIHTYKKIKIQSAYGDVYTKERRNNAGWSEKPEDGIRYFMKNTNTSDVWKDATKEERYAAWNYTQGSDYLTTMLRGEIAPEYTYGSKNQDVSHKATMHPRKLHEFMGDCAALTDLLSRSYSNTDVWVKRDEGFGIFSSKLALPKGFDYYYEHTSDLVGRTITDPSFQSTGYCKDTYFNVKNVILNIYCPKGTRLITAECFNNYTSMWRVDHCGTKDWDGDSFDADLTHENEVILQRGTTGVITKVEAGYHPRYASARCLFVDIFVTEQNPVPVTGYRHNGYGYTAVFGK